MDIHNTSDKLEKMLNKIDKDKLQKDNKRLLLEFKDDLIAKGIGNKRILKYVSTLRSMLLIMKKPASKLDTDDAKSIVRSIETNKKWSEWTKHDRKIIFRIFGTWLNKNYKTKLDFSWMSIRVKNRHRLPEGILIEDDIKELIEKADTLRDKALISVLYDSGCRIGEILSLQLKHVSFDDYGSVILVDGKTGQRRVRMINSSALLSSYIDTHPFKNDKESFLWLTRKNVINRKSEYTPLMYRGVQKMLRNVVKKTGIKKKVNPHAFRHARATKLAQHLTEAQMKEFFGWTQASSMASVYVHLSGKNIDDALLKVYGLAKNDKDEQGIRPITCPRCKETNSTLQNFCKRCGSPLSLEVALDVEQMRREKEDAVAMIIDRLKDDVLIADKIRKTIKELKLQKKFEEL